MRNLYTCSTNCILMSSFNPLSDNFKRVPVLSASSSYNQKNACVRKLVKIPQMRKLIKYSEGNK